VPRLLLVEALDEGLARLLTLVCTPVGSARRRLCTWRLSCSNLTAGSITVRGHPTKDSTQLGRVGFVAQNTPGYVGYPSLTTCGSVAWGNPAWDRWSTRGRRSDRECGQGCDAR
jgi:hypothetical protein